jgi:hypothetical protein
VLPEGHEAAVKAILRNGIRIIEAKDFEAQKRERLRFYEEWAGGRCTLYTSRDLFPVWSWHDPQVRRTGTFVETGQEGYRGP